MGACESIKYKKEGSIVPDYNYMAKNRINPLYQMDSNNRFERKMNQHNTTKQTTPITLEQIGINLKNEDNIKNRNLKTAGKPNIPTTVVRKKKRSMSLVEKFNIGTKLFKEEMKLKVTPQALVEERQGLPTTKYKVLSKLGDGSFGTVFLVINQYTNAQVAMKKINKLDAHQEKRLSNAHDEQSVQLTTEDISIKNEIDILRKLDHPNIVKIIEFFSTNKAYYIINDFCSHGELFKRIKIQLCEVQLAVLFYQIFSGLCYLHDHHICHRDLKLENIMISDIEKDLNDGFDYYWIKIIDFGTATIFNQNKNDKDVVGSSYYIAPEVFKKEYNEKCDTWSAGVILHMLIVGKAPFDGSDDDEIFARISKGLFNTQNDLFLSSSAEVQDLISKLLEVNVDRRLSAKQALKHQWFKKFNAKRLYSNIPKTKVIEYINRLTSYKISSKLQQIVLAFIVHNIPSNKETKDILKIFRLFNSSDNGKLTKIELRNGLCQYIAEQKVNEIINDIFFVLDGANHGYIQFEEFLRACLNKKNLLTDEMLSYAFNFIDKDNSNTITAMKIKECFKETSGSNELFQYMFKEIHNEEDGEIDYIEFKEMMLEL